MFYYQRGGNLSELTRLEMSFGVKYSQRVSVNLHTLLTHLLQYMIHTFTFQKSSRGNDGKQRKYFDNVGAIKSDDLKKG